MIAGTTRVGKAALIDAREEKDALKKTKTKGHSVKMHTQRWRNQIVCVDSANVGRYGEIESSI